MEVYYSIIIFIFGLLFGSFYNVVGFRLPKNLSIISPGSFCPKCNHELKWYELIPVFSYIFLAGKCKCCKNKISLFYPCTELITGILFMFSYLFFGFSGEFIISLMIVSYLMIVIVSDINYLIIPDEVTLFFVIATTIVKFVAFGLGDTLYSLLSALLLFIAMYLIMLIGNKLFKKESLGGGDIKLMFFVGLVIGPIEGLFSLFLSSLIALPISLLLYWKNKSTIVPFGPFILIALIMIYWFGEDIFTLIGIM